MRCARGRYLLPPRRLGIHGEPTLYRRLAERPNPDLFEHPQDFQGRLDQVVVINFVPSRGCSYRAPVVREEFSRTTDGEKATHREGFSGATVGSSITEPWAWSVSCPWESRFQG